MPFRTARERYTVALAVALAIHAIVFLLIPTSTPPTRETRVVTERIALERHTPPPTPAPTPPPVVPTPKITPPPRASLAPVNAVRAPAPKSVVRPKTHVGGAAAPRKIAIRPPRLHLSAPPPSLADATHLGQQNGGVGTGAGPGSGDGGLGGTGTGTGGTGTGNGGLANSTCGDIYLMPADVQYKSDGTVVQFVLAKLVEKNGDVLVDKFPYPFTYPAEKDNPFAHTSIGGADGGIPVQEPPPGSDITTFPPAIQQVLRNTDPSTGHTSLARCTQADDDGKTSGN